MKRRLRIDVIAYAAIGAWVVLASYISVANPTIGISDMFAFIANAENLHLSSSAAWVNGFYPFGYPLLLKGMFLITGDYVLAGRILSLVFASIGLLVVFRMASSFAGEMVALLAVVICATNPVYLDHATMSGTDMPAAVLLMVGAHQLCRWGKAGRMSRLLAAGGAIGCAYLVRYTALVVMPAMMLWLLLRESPPVSWKRRASQVLLLLGAFLLVASPQLVLSAVHKGNPFYNSQAQNVYFGMFGEGSWGLKMHEARAVTSIADVVLRHPGAFLRNWYWNMLNVPGLDLVQFPFTLVAFAAILFSFKDDRLEGQNLLLALLFLAFTSAICMAFTSARLLLFGGMVLAVFSAYGLFAFLPEHFRLAFSRAFPVRIPFLLVVVVWLLWNYVRPAVAHPLSEYDRNRIHVSQALAAEGSGRASEVLSLSFDYYDATKPTKDRFCIPWYGANFEPYDSVGDIAQRMQTAGQRYFVYDERAPRSVRELRKIWPFEEEDLNTYFHPIAVFDDTVRVYRLRNAEKRP